MTAIDHHYLPARKGFPSTFATAALAVGRTIAKAMKVRHDRAILHTMPDHLLHDLGISRSDIEYVTARRDFTNRIYRGEASDSETMAAQEN